MESFENASGAMVLEGMNERALAELLQRYGLRLERVPDGEPIPGTYWGEPEAGLVGTKLFARGDTPVHSVLHEACHFICMGEERRRELDRDAGGDDAEENAVCYLQVLLAEHLPGVGRLRMFGDMDLWGYSFRLGKTRRWFEEDAADAREWLFVNELIDREGVPRWPETI